jgi:predicted RNase H-like HicB family nuclease
MRKPLSEYVTATYPFSVEADPGVGYFISFPDLPGCMTQVERAEEIGAKAEEIRTLWLESAYAQGLDIPEPTPAAGSGSPLVLRLPRSLHRTLAQEAEREGVDLDQYATAILARGDALSTVERHLQEIEDRLASDRRSVPTRAT